MVYSTRRFVLSLALCYFVLVFLVLLALRLPRLGKRANFSAFRTCFRFARVWFCLFPLPLGVWEGLWLVIVALPGMIYFKREAMFKIWYLGLILNYPTHFHDHVTPKLGLT